MAATENGLAAAASFPYFNRHILDEAHTVMGQLAPQGITSFSFTPSNGLVMVTQSGEYFAHGIPDECFSKLGQMMANGTRIHCIAFPPAGGNQWVITGDNDLFARNIDGECYQMMRNLTQGGRRITRVAFPYTGGWTVVAQDEFHARGIDNECFQQMQNFAAGGWQLHNVAFSPQNNGWSLCSRG